MGNGYAPLIGEIRAINMPNGAVEAPAGWLLCDGRTLDLNTTTDYVSLAAVIGFAYGAGYGPDGRPAFKLPNLCDSVAIGVGQAPGSTTNYLLGSSVGSNNVTLTSDQMPSHSHLVSSRTSTTEAGRARVPSLEASPGSSSPPNAYSAATSPIGVFASQTLGATGRGLPHVNTQPVLAVAYYICYEGIYPSI